MRIEVEAQMAGNVWKVETTAGTVVEEDDVLVVLESMKMEIAVKICLILSYGIAINSIW